MKIRRTGRGCYVAESQSEVGVSYILDIKANDGLGYCSCIDFTGRRFPRWRGIKKPYDSMRCKHLKRVRNYELDLIIKYYIEKEKNGLKAE